MTNTAQLLEDSLLVIWNDRNADRRLEAMQRIYAPDIRFFEGDAAAPVIGYQAINELISNLQTGWAAEFQFELHKQPQANHGVQLISWGLGVPGAPPVATGSDVAVIESNLIQSLYLFLDASENE